MEVALLHWARGLFSEKVMAHDTIRIRGRRFAADRALAAQRAIRSRCARRGGHCFEDYPPESLLRHDLTMSGTHTEAMYVAEACFQVAPGDF